MSTLQFLGLPQDGRVWRIAGLAHVLTVPYRTTPMVEVIISTETSSAREYQVVELSVAAWSRLAVGRCWRNGIRVPGEGNGQRRVIDLRIERSAMHLAKQTLTGAHVPPAVKAAMQGSRCIVFEVGHADVDESRFVAVPCAELFRVGWCQTAVIPYLILSGVYLGPGERLFNPKRSFWQDGFAFVHLGIRTPNRAAQLMARIAFDKAAHKATQRIISDMIAARNQEVPKYPIIVTPPFSGRSQWEVSGDPIMWGRRHGFLINQILKWPAPKMFDRVGSYRDNPGGDAVVTQDVKGAFAGMVRRQPSDKRELVQVSEAGDPDEQDMALTLFDAEENPVDQQLPRTVYKNPNPQSQGGSRTIEDTAENRIFSTGHSVKESQFATAELEMWPSGKGDETKPGTLAFFEKTIDLLPGLAEELAEKHGALIDLDVSHEIVAMTWGTLHRPRRIWSRIFVAEHGSRARRVCVAYISINGELFTIFEIERRPTEDSQATLGVRGHPTNSELKTIFFVCAGNVGQLADAEWARFELTHFERIHFKHCARTAEDYARYILHKLYARPMAARKKRTEVENLARTA